MDNLRAISLAVLERLEWIAWDDEPCCPICGSYRHRLKKRRTHADGCELDAVIRALRTEIA